MQKILFNIHSRLQSSLVLFVNILHFKILQAMLDLDLKRHIKGPSRYYFSFLGFLHAYASYFYFTNFVTLINNKYLYC